MKKRVSIDIKGRKKRERMKGKERERIMHEKIAHEQEQKTRRRKEKRVIRYIEKQEVKDKNQRSNGGQGLKREI